MMHSVFFRRLVAALIITVLLAAAFMAAGYIFMTRDTYTKIKLEEMLPKAEAVRQLVIEHKNGEVSDQAFERLSQTLMRAASATTLIIDNTGAIEHMNNAIEGLSSEATLAALEDGIAAVLAGNTLQDDGIRIDGFGEVIAVGEPIFDDAGSIIGGVFIVKSIQEIIDATEKIGTSLFWIAIIIVPLIMLVLTLRVRRITDPLHSMSEVAIKMSAGDFKIRADEEQMGEVGVLARALNNLCENLSATIYQLRTEKGQLDELLQSLTDGVAATDSIGALTHYNSALMRMFGAVNVTKREELISDPMVWAAFDEVYLSGSPQTVTYPMAGDKTLWITISPVNTDDGGRTGVVGLFKDMTEMERLERMRREYVANVSHELRTPLTAVRGLLEPLADGMVKDEEDRQRYYKIMLHEVMRLSRLISDMMKLSKLQSGTDYIEVGRTDMMELLGDILSSYSATARQKGIALEADAQNVPDVITDPDRIEQVLVILLDNAMHYTPEGGSITVRARDGERVLISVEDTGCGIPEADIPHIFERFYKVDKSRGEGGTGLGLSIAQYIIDQLGEKITVDSVLGKGTTFSFTLKKYSANAIPLGPANEERPERCDIAVNADEEHNSSKIVDAAYELIPDIPKADRKNDTAKKRHKK